MDCLFGVCVTVTSDGKEPNVIFQQTFAKFRIVTDGAVVPATEFVFAIPVSSENIATSVLFAGLLNYSCGLSGEGGSDENPLILSRLSDSFAEPAQGIRIGGQNRTKQTPPSHSSYRKTVGNAFGLR